MTFWRAKLWRKKIVLVVGGAGEEHQGILGSGETFCLVLRTGYRV